MFGQYKDKKYFIAFVTEDFFEEGLAKKKKFIGLFYMHKWYYLGKTQNYNESHSLKS